MSLVRRVLTSVCASSSPHIGRRTCSCGGTTRTTRKLARASRQGLRAWAACEADCAEQEAYAFITACQQSGGVCFVHCAQGVSRSGAVVVDYVMRSQGLDYDAALALVRKGRLVAQPNSAFEAQLRRK